MSNSPEVPGERIPYDLDGSICVRTTGAGVVTALTDVERKGLNSLRLTGDIPGWAMNATVAIVFPTRRDLSGFFHAVAFGNFGGSTHAIEVSTDTTTGLDGSWSLLYGPYAPPMDVVRPQVRENIFWASAPGVIGVRVRCASVALANQVSPVRLLHLYSAPNYVARHALALWHPALDAPLPGNWLDFGEQGRGQSATKTFRVKNMSPSMTATAPVLSIDVLTDTTPGLAAQHALAPDGVTFGATVTLANLAPGAISPVVTLRRQTSASANLWLWETRIVAKPTSWA